MSPYIGKQERLRGGWVSDTVTRRHYTAKDAGPLCRGGCGTPVVRQLAAAGIFVHPTCAEPKPATVPAAPVVVTPQPSSEQPHAGTCPFGPGRARDLCSSTCPRLVCTGKP